MSKKSRVPQTIPDFNNYINNTDDYQQAGAPTINAVRLGLSTQNSLDWKNKRIAWVALYKKYIDPAVSTTVIRKDVRKAMLEFKNFAQPLLNVMAVNATATNLDAEIFGFTLVRKRPSKPTVPMNISLVLDIKSIGGGDIVIKCRTSADGRRASKPAGADSLQFAYLLGETPPSNANDETTKELSTKSSFTFHAGSSNSGKMIHVFARWFNTKHPELAAPWSAMVSITVG